ncbi:MAG: NTP transferase domain-containing protein [Candidatus Odinarchaeota archaeon]
MILAAGVGERARPLTNDIPKALVSVAGRTLLDWSLHDFSHAGIKNITLAIGYKASLIEKHLQSGEQQKDCESNITIVPVRDYEIGPLRTALSAIETFSDEEFFICPVDAFVGSDNIKDMLNKYEHSRGMILAVDYTATSGTPVYVDKGGFVVGLGNSVPEGVFSTGRSAMMLIANRTIVDYCRSALLQNENRLVFALNRMIHDGIPLYSHDVHSKWFDIDTLSDIILLNRHLLESRVAQDVRRGLFVSSGDSIQIGDSLVLKNSDVVVNANVHLQGPVLLLPSCRIDQDCRIGPNVTIGLAARISGNCELTNTIVYGKSAVHANSHIENAIVYGSKIYHAEL